MSPLLYVISRGSTSFGAVLPEDDASCLRTAMGQQVAIAHVLCHTDRRSAHLGDKLASS